MSIAEKLTTIAENVPKVYKAGQDELWYGILDVQPDFSHGRTNFSQLFRDWKLEYIRPPITITPKNKGSANQMFRDNTLLKKIEAGYVDFSQLPKGDSNTEGFHYTFYGCKALEEIQDVGIGNPNSVCSFNYTFYGCTALKTIASITITEDTTFNCAFHHCRALENLTIKGTIGQNGLNLSWSPLSKKSIESVIGALSGNTNGLSITLSKAAINNAFGINLDDEKTYPEGTEYHTLRNSKDKWTINYE